ncbi:MAG: hypothetical protein GY898_27700 [Proteobacteria bacterium]|nr:hypothetical protein [Pseudomonadota bacterium]
MRPLVAAFALLLPTVVFASVPTLAVTYFDNNSSEARYDPLGHGLADMLITDLSGLEQLQVVERGRLAEVLKELELQSSSFVDPSTAVEVGKGLGAQYVLTGAFAAVDPSMRIDARIVNVATGEVVQADQVTGQADEFFLLEKELATQIVNRLGVSMSARESARMGRIATENFDAFVAYSNGLAALDRGSLDEARDALNAALEADDRFALASSALEDLEERLKQYEGQQRAAISAYATDILKKLDAAESSGDFASLDPVTLELQVRLVGVKASADILVVTGKLLDLGLPEDQKMGGPQGLVGVNEWALSSYVTAAAALGHRGDVLTYGEAFLKRYPGSAAYGPFVKSAVDLVITTTREEKAGAKQIPAIRADALAFPLQMGCAAHRDPAKKLKACTDWVALLDESGDLLEPNEDAETRWAQAGKHAGDIAAIEAALAHAKARDRYAAAVEDVSEILGDAKESAAKADAAVAELASASTADDFYNAGFRLMYAARYDEARDAVERGLKRHPTSNDLYGLGVNLGLYLFDLGYAEQMLTRWEAAEAQGAAVDASLRRSVRELPGEIEQAEQLLGMGLFKLASGLAIAKQYEAAGDAYMAMYEAGQDPEGSLSAAGGHFWKGYLPDRARIAYQTLLDEFPNGAYAGLARQMLESLP